MFRKTFRKNYHKQYKDIHLGITKFSNESTERKINSYIILVFNLKI